jgi:stage V sporulation protein G
MEITEVRISPSKGGKVRAFASIVLDDCFMINDLRVMEGREGQLYVTMPARKGRNGQLRDIAHPLSADIRKVIEDRVLEEFTTAEASLAVPSRDDRDGGRKDRQSPVTRLTSKLFSEEYWTAEPSSNDADID